MNNPSGMHELKPFYNFSQVKFNLPTCMFKMANIHGESEISVFGEQPEQADPAMEALAQRQEGILRELRGLEAQVANLTSQIQPDSKTSVPAASAVSPSGPSNVISGGLHDVVVYANPKNPPYSLLVLYEQLKQQYRCMTRVHVHSSVSSVPDKLLHHFSQNGVQMVGNRTEAQLSLTLIWKNVTHGPEMKIQANCQTPIRGEVNILRYLARLLTPAYDSGNIVTATSIDGFLDLASSAILNGSSKEKAAAVRTLNSALGKQSWLVGGSSTVADVAVWSALHQTRQNTAAPSNVQKWLKACASLSEFRTAVSCVA